MFRIYTNKFYVYNSGMQLYSMHKCTLAKIVYLILHLLLFIQNLFYTRICAQEYNSEIFII